MAKYYFYLTIGICTVSAVLVSFYFWTNSIFKPEHLEVKTTYNYTSVEGALQPLPTIKTIDHNWKTLGKALFNSTLLSSDNTISCASCHMIDFGGDDGFPVSTGVGSKTGQRNSPSILNAVFNFRQFWDGRATDLTEQASGPIHNPVEMGSNWQEIIPKLKRDRYFSEAFSRVGIKNITADSVLKAIVVFEESLITPNAPLDRYLKGDLTALNEHQIRGFETFKSIGCITCHQGKNIGGNIFQKLGRIDLVPKHLLGDEGKYTITKREQDKHVFKVPSLRNVAETGPYFHNGSVNTLSEAVNIMALTQLGLSLSEQQNKDLVAFLSSLSAPVDGGKYE